MKKVLITMIVMYALITGPLSGIWSFLPGMNSSVEASYIYPIYGGIILLSGLVVGCTVLILEAIKSLEEEIKKDKDNKC